MYIAEQSFYVPAAIYQAMKGCLWHRCEKLFHLVFLCLLQGHRCNVMNMCC